MYRTMGTLIDDHAHCFALASVLKHLSPQTGIYSETYLPSDTSYPYNWRNLKACDANQNCTQIRSISRSPLMAPLESTKLLLDRLEVMGPWSRSSKKLPLVRNHRSEEWSSYSNLVSLQVELHYSCPPASRAPIRAANIVTTSTLNEIDLIPTQPHALHPCLVISWASPARLRRSQRAPEKSSPCQWRKC